MKFLTLSFLILFISKQLLNFSSEFAKEFQTGISQQLELTVIIRGPLFLLQLKQAYSGWHHTKTSILSYYIIACRSFSGTGQIAEVRNFWINNFQIGTISNLVEITVTNFFYWKILVQTSRLYSRKLPLFPKVFSQG